MIFTITSRRRKIAERARRFSTRERPKPWRSVRPLWHVLLDLQMPGCVKNGQTWKALQTGALSVGDKEALGAKNLGLAINLGGLIFFDCVTMKLIARSVESWVSPLVLHQLDMDHFRECLKRSWAVDGPGVNITHAQTTVEEARRQNLARQAEGAKRPRSWSWSLSPFQVWSDRTPIFGNTYTPVN